MTLPKLHVCVLVATLAIVSHNHTKAEDKEETGVTTATNLHSPAQLSTTSDQHKHQSSSEIPNSQLFTEKPAMGSSTSSLEDNDSKSNNEMQVLNHGNTTSKVNSESNATKGSQGGPTLKDRARRRYEEAYQRLQKFIYSTPSVVNRIPPYDLHSCSPYDKIFLRFTPFKVLAVDEVEQSVTISCYVTLKWYDKSLWWEPKDYADITNISVKTSDLWTPVIFLPTSNGHGLYLTLPEYVTLQHHVYNLALTVPFEFTVLCELNLTRYPFDEQECEVIFTELHGYLISGKDNRDSEYQLIENLTTDGEWKIIKNYIKDTPWDGKFSSVRHIIKIHRRSTFYLANFLIPLALTSLMTLLVFWIPAESGEKMSFLVSMFVSTSVFLFIINDEIPRSITVLPPVNIMITAVICEIFCASVATLFVLRRYQYYVKSNRVHKDPAINLKRKDDEVYLLKTSKFTNVLSSQVDMMGTKGGHSSYKNSKPGHELRNPVWNTKLQPANESFTAPPNEAIKNKFYNNGSYILIHEENQTCLKKVVDCLDHVTLDYFFFFVFLLLNIFGGAYLFVSLI